MSGFRLTLAAAGVSAAIELMAVGSAYQPTAPQPTFRTGINFVRVDVTGSEGAKTVTEVVAFHVGS
jgi:hypothetical protein